MIALGLLDPGDEMLVPPARAINPYHQAAELAGATVVDIRTTMATNFTLTAEMVEAHVTPKSKILVLDQSQQPDRDGDAAGRGRAHRRGGAPRTT